MGVSLDFGVEIDIKHSGDVFHELYSANPHKVSSIIPHTVQSCDVLEGEFGKPGAVIQWNYTHDGKKCYVKEIVESIDEEKKMVRFKVTEGDMLEGYKSMTIVLHVINKGEIDAVKWSFEAERFEDYGPYPTQLVDLFIEMTREIEAHHLKL